MANPQPSDGNRVMLPVMRREAAIVAGTFDAEQRTFDIMWTAGAEVPRIDWWTGTRYVEVLDVAEKSIRLGRLKSGRAPVLNSHSTWGLDSVLGVIEGESVRIVKGEGHAKVRLSKREDVAGLVGDIADDIICNVSPGYITHAYREEVRNGVTYRTATDWEPVEISFCPVGADPDAGKRAQDAKDVPTYPCLVSRAIAPAGVLAAARMRMRQLAGA